MNRGSPFEYAEVFNCLHWLEAEGLMRQTDRDRLNEAIDYLGDKLFFALGMTSGQMHKLITMPTGEL